MSEKKQKEKDKIGLIAIDDITEKQWNDIRVIAGYMFDRGDYAQNQFKIAIAAFFTWVNQQGPNAAVDLDKFEGKPNTLLN